MATKQAQDYNNHFGKISHAANSNPDANIKRHEENLQKAKDGEFAKENAEKDPEISDKY